MNSSEEIKDLVNALCKAQSAMGAAKKDSINPHFNSKYADLAAIVEALRGPFTDNGLAYTQLPRPSEKQEIIVETVLLHTSGQWISNLIAMPVTKADAQGFKSAITYARRAGLECISGIPADDDDGNAAAKGKPRATESEMMPRPSTMGTHADIMDVPRPSLMADIMDVPQMVSTKPEGGTKVTFEYKKGQYTTAGMTKEQFIKSLELAKDVTIKYKDPNKAHALLIKEFEVTSRSELTEDTGGKYLARLQELADSE
jgi:hypothetical protein